MTRKFLVTADHVVPRHACVDLEARCSETPIDANGTLRWYAVMAGYGCSKNYKAPETAIREMLLDHACINVRIREVLV